MKRKIEFETNQTESVLAATTKPATKTKSFDETYIQTHRGIQLKFERKVTWIRFIPAIRGSSEGPIFTFSRYHDQDGKFPTFVDPELYQGESVFAHASKWLRKNKPEVLASKKNPDGWLRLYPQARGLAWVVDAEAEKGKRLRLLNLSMYDGSRGGNPGLGFQIVSEANAVDDERGSPTYGEPLNGNIFDTEAGREVGITLLKPATGDSKFANYSVKIGKTDKKLDLDCLTDEEFDLMKPLETLIKKTSVAEQKEYLKQYIGEELFKEIFPAG